MNRPSLPTLFALAFALAPIGAQAQAPARARSGQPAAAPAANAPGAAPSQPSEPHSNARVEVLVLEGSNGAGGVDPAVQNIAELRRAPFSAYTQIRLVSRSTIALAPDAQPIALPNGSAVVTSTGRGANGRHQVSVQLTLNGRTHNLQFAATPGVPFFSARSTGQGGALILGFIVR